MCNVANVSYNLGVHWGINTRVTDILRDEQELRLYRQARLVHVSLGTEAAAQLNLNLFRKETTIVYWLMRSLLEPMRFV